jgi:hypothetical protein
MNMNQIRLALAPSTPNLIDHSRTSYQFGIVHPVAVSAHPVEIYNNIGKRNKDKLFSELKDGSLLLLLLMLSF